MAQLTFSALRKRFQLKDLPTDAVDPGSRLVSFASWKHIAIHVPSCYLEVLGGSSHLVSGY